MVVKKQLHKGIPEVKSHLALSTKISYRKRYFMAMHVYCCIRLFTCVLRWAAAQYCTIFIRLGLHRFPYKPWCSTFCTGEN